MVDFNNRKHSANSSSANPEMEKLERISAIAPISLELSLRGKPNKDGIPFLIECLDDPNQRIAHAAAIALSSFGKEAAPAIPALARVVS